MNSNADRGLLAKENGKNFEDLFEVQAKSEGLAATRTPDGCKQIGAKKLIRVKAPWDWVVSRNGKTALIDTKTTTHKTFGHSNIDQNQVGKMVPHNRQGVLAGYVIRIQGINRVIYISAQNLSMRIGVKGSFDHSDSDVLTLGTCDNFRIASIFEPLSSFAQWIETERKAIDGTDKGMSGRMETGNDLG